MAKLNIKTPSGFPEFTPQQEQIRQQWIGIIQGVFESYGFSPVTTPLVEREENLLSKGGNAKEMYVLKRLHDEGSDKSHSGNALRFDHTVPLALYVARHQNDITFPFKRYTIGPVLRGERAQKGRFRQFDQCDIDIIGNENLSVINDAQVVAVIVEIFEQLNIGDFVVRINNRKILRGLFSSFGVPEEKEKAVLDAVDDLEKIGEEKTRIVLSECGISDESIQILFAVFAGDQTVLDSIENEILQEGVSEMKTVVDSLESMGVNTDCYKVDYRIARGLDYYTGSVFETNIIDAPEFGSICSGGRYEDLASVFTGKKMPGVGISIGLTRLLSQVFDAGKVESASTPIDVLVLPYGEEEISASLQLGQELRSNGLKVDVYTEKKKIGKKFDYADKIGVEWVAILGEDEIKEGLVQMKNMKTGESQKVKREDVLDLF